MQRDKALGSIRSVKTTTKVLAWVMTVEGKHYQICTYESRWTGSCTTIWESNRSGSNRINPNKPVYHMSGQDHFLAATRFLDELELAEIDQTEA